MIRKERIEKLKVKRSKKFLPAVCYLYINDFSEFTKMIVKMHYVVETTGDFFEF